MSKNLEDFLSNISFFSEVSKTSLKQLANQLSDDFYIKNETIFEKNTVGHTMYVILNGTVKIHDKDHVYDTLSTGDCFGEYALIDNETRSASATALEKTTVLKIEREAFINLMKHDIGFSQGILAAMIKRHRELDLIQERLASSKLEIERTNNKISGLINGAMDAIIMFDTQFKIVLTNPSANLLFENEDVLQRNVLFFFDEQSANLIETLVESGIANASTVNNYLPDTITVIGSKDTHTINEGTISKSGHGSETFFTLILRNIEERLITEDKIKLLTKQTKYLEEEIKELTSSYGIIAAHHSMKKALNLVHQVAKTDATVLIHGETGTGKELIARAIHKESNRNDKPLIRINCGAIPANLIESELFGHEKGAFTGATVSRKGRFLLADKGTIFLDEIGEMPLELQPKLLRVIQEGEFDPVGSSETIKVDVRIIAATHRDLLERSHSGKFREDLFYRLNVFPIEVPALRDREQDICLIAQEMINLFSKKLHKTTIHLTKADKALLTSYHWPGNVRELQNLIERAVIVSENGMINWQTIIPNTLVLHHKDAPVSNDRVLTSKELITLEKENILKALKQTKWKISGKQGAAELLQIPPTTLASRIKALKIERPV
ncbi:sigma 54-interacting transcriptional regulator [Tamlana fucoidanivorans]|uniref:Cyclic nucleotide-binding domain-containing protein n=1 Tax=Allotamlana fucoidanivorans TaxID=2583814 RepID=A0A5C4SDL0_9FLAO|nr:sigma 54-interacting transcriptional regulator [Tamlana fucoidanivorans]TNJ41469.1 cyclic nucleotide-binding domain-containing protein [Tamlana fucoidanivorans]